jgi:hypothetical protein
MDFQSIATCGNAFDPAQLTLKRNGEVGMPVFDHRHPGSVLALFSSSNGPSFFTA